MIDGMAASISVPTFILLGHHFASGINQLWHLIDDIKEVVIPLFIAAVAIGLALYLLRRRQRHMVVATSPYGRAVDSKAHG
jgi:membrane protein DedA with SNARE-associated domain